MYMLFLPMDPHIQPEKVIGDYLCMRQEGPIAF